MKTFWVDTRFACGGISVNSNGIIVDTPPIWRVWLGQRFAKFVMYYKLSEDTCIELLPQPKEEEAEKN